MSVRGPTNEPLLRLLARRYPAVKKLADRAIAKVPLSLRLSRAFWTWYAFLEESEQWTPTRLKEHQLHGLQELLRRVSQTGGSFSKNFELLSINDINSIESFQRLIPTMSRDEFRAQFGKAHSATEIRGRTVLRSTSGTTGNALQFQHRLEDEDREWASICHQWRRVGYDPARSRRAEFRGLTSRGQLIDFFPRSNMVRCSILDLRAENLPAYADALRSHGVDFFHGYPSALYLLARAIHQRGYLFPQPKGVLLASEPVYDFQLNEIQSAFPNAKLYAHYGCAERVVLAGWCEHRREYHILPQYALVEVDCANSEIVGTNLYNDVNPFIRYRMGDTAQNPSDTPCPACKRPYPRIADVGGRAEDYLFSPERGWIPPAIVTYPLKSLRAIHEIQFVQDDPRSLRVRFTVFQAASDLLRHEMVHLEHGLRELFGAEMKIGWEQADSFARGPTGKFKWIHCSLSGQPTEHRQKRGATQ